MPVLFPWYSSPFPNDAQLLRAGRVRGLGGGAFDPEGRVLIEDSDGATFWVSPQQIEPDFLSLGVE